jgi:beta-mannosidase
MSRRTSLELSGLWRAAPSDEAGTRAHEADTEIDDSAWTTVPVPGHWRSTDAFAEHDGPLTYRRHFTSEALGPSTGERSFLVVEGAMAAADVWLDGAYLGDTSGYVVPHWFEVTDLLRARREHVLAMEVACDPVGTGRTNDLTGAFGRSALLGSGHNPGGIWRPVSVHTTGPVRIRHCRLRCPRADADSATLAVRVVLDSDEHRPVGLRTWVTPVDTDDGAPRAPSATVEQSDALMEGAVAVVEREHPLAAGENRIEFTVPVRDPQLWWPRALGDQPLYDVVVEVVVDDLVSDSHRWRTGLREVRMDGFVTTVNGERLFLKGVCIGPTRELLAEADPAEVAADVHRAVDLGLDLVRVHGHIARDELYEAADRAGMLLWQDLPIQWALQRQARPAARRLARHAVDELAHHPSLLVWCAHHEPWSGDPRTWRAGGDDAERRSRLRWLTAQALPSWNRTVLDRNVAETLSTSDGSRPVIPHSGVWPHLPQLSGTSTHLWAGWRWGQVGDLARLLRWWPRLGRFVAEFGAQAPAGDGALLDLDGDAAERWPDLDWTALSQRFALELGPLRRRFPPEQHRSLAEWTDAVQAHQADVVRQHVETLRRLKYRPTGGFTAFALADPAPGATAALLDEDRRPKPALDALREACAPVVAVLDRLPDALEVGRPTRLACHVVNDRRQATGELRLVATATWSTTTDADDAVGAAAIVGDVRTGWTGTVGPDAVGAVGTLVLTPPAGATRLDLSYALHEGGTLLGERTIVRSVVAR